MDALSLGPRQKRIRFGHADGDDSTVDHKEAAAASSWTELPADLLSDVSHRLHTATDYVCFHAVCKSWSKSLPPEPWRPAMLPWLLTPPDAAGHRTARCIFSSKWTSRRWDVTASLGRVRCSRVVRANSGCTAVVDPASSSCKVKSRDESVDHAIGTVGSDGTIVRCLFSLAAWDLFDVSLYLLRPGSDAAAWTWLKTNLMTISGEKGRCSVAYHDGKIILCCGNASCCIATTPSPTTHAGNHRLQWTPVPVDSWEQYESSYVLESRGELLWVVVQVKSHLALDFYDVVVDRAVCGRLASGLSVSVHALQGGESETGEPRWEKWDGRSFTDQIMFLGVPTSFAVDAARFDISDGCAYFVVTRSLSAQRSFRVGDASWVCLLFKHSFRDGKSEFIEQLPGGQDGAACSWLTPQPAFSYANRG